MISLVAATVLVTTILLVPLATYSASTIIPCGNSNTSGENGGTRMNPCTFHDLIVFINNFINFALAIMTAIATIVILYAGFLYLTSGPNPENRSKATGMFWNIGKGFFFVAGAYLIVKFIIIGLVAPSVSSQIFTP
jgi:hypothetical protein